MPALDPGRLAVMAREAGTSAADEFFRTYLRLLPARIDRIADAFARSDPDAAMDAVLSLKVTSSMVGAVHLELYCQGLQGQLSNGYFTDADSVRAALTAHAAQVLHEAATVPRPAGGHRQSPKPAKMSGPGARAVPQDGRS
jgi:HPt (histidine-containing phosphotransfer) domain-containing protein